MGRGWNASLPANCFFAHLAGFGVSMGFQLCGLMRFGAVWRGLIRRERRAGRGNGESRKQKSEVRNQNLTALTSESF
jgi:hypothetical protein